MKKDAINGKLLLAAELLEKSAAEIKALTKKADDLELGNARLKLTVMALERSGAAKELAEEMFRKGMISRGDVLNKANEIMEYNDDAFAVLKKTVDNTKPENYQDSSFISDTGEIDKEAALLYDNRETFSKSNFADKVNKRIK